MRIFKGEKKSSEWRCPICGEMENKMDYTLVTLSGTEIGNIAKAVPVHIECLNLSLIEIGGRIIMSQIID